MVMFKAAATALLASSLLAPLPFSSAQPQVSLPVIHSGLGGGLVTDITGSGRRPADDDVLFVALRDGLIKTVDLQNPTTPAATFLDLTLLGLVNRGATERGLLGLAFHPSYATNGHFFVHYSCNNGSPSCASNGGAIIARYTANDGVVDTNSGVVLEYIPQPASNHNGGGIQFGPDGKLYIAMGDGGNSYDSASPGAGQDETTLLGKMLRVDVDSIDPASALPRWTIPTDNPFVNNAGYRDEIWSIGLRNPWRFSFDRDTDDLWIADVGQGAREEINFTPASSTVRSITGGLNYGWCGCEGNAVITVSSSCGFPTCPFCTNTCASRCPPPDGGGGCTAANDESPYNGVPYAAPAFDYNSNNGDCSVTGGYVYRGTNYPALHGKYFYADYCGRELRALESNGSGGWTTADVNANGVSTSGGTTTFGEDNAGELYVGDASGKIYQIVTPTVSPTLGPTESPSRGPTASPNNEPTTSAPTESPTEGPTDGPTTVPSTNPTGAPFSVVGCPATYQATAILDDELTLRYSVVLDAGAPYAGVLCAELELRREAWVGFGISTNGQMSGSEAVIGRFDDGGSVLKYNLDGQNAGAINVMPSQTLQVSSLDRTAGVTTLTFAKLLVEPGEIAVDGTGINTFLYAYGPVGDAWTQHDGRASFDLDFSPCAVDADCAGGGTGCLPKVCASGLCSDEPLCPTGVECTEPVCATCGQCNDEAGCVATSGCDWSGGCSSGGSCTACDNQPECASAGGCNWNTKKGWCKGTPTNVGGTCTGTARPVGTCATTCVPDTEICDDGIDNDCDGATDCDDSECASAANCAVTCVPETEICDDNIDNDCDGATDCNDPDCLSDTVACPTVETDCSNGVDDDGDTLIDCDDPDCLSDTVACPAVETDCSNGVDDDGDTLIDCDDPDCASDANCCGAVGSSCTVPTDCCGNKCKGGGNKTCK